MAKSSVPLHDRITLSRLEAASLLGVNVRLIDHAVADGSLPSIRHGKRLLIRRIALDGWLEKQEVQAPLTKACVSSSGQR